MPLTDFLPVSYHELKVPWCRYRGRDLGVQRLVLEVQRFRGVVDEAYQRQQVIEKCWREQGHGQRVALEKLRCLTEQQKDALAKSGTRRRVSPVKLRKDEARSVGLVRVIPNTATMCCWIAHQY